MKANKYLSLGMAATGVAIAGAIIFFTSTRKGKNTMNKWSAKGKKMSDEIKEIINDAKRKIKDLKEEMISDCATEGANENIR
jgi:hypothetical protein